MLPTETLLEILGQDFLGPADFAQLCSVSRQFRSIVCHKLYSTVEAKCALDNDPWSRHSPVAPETTKLLKTLKKSKELADAVQIIRFAYHYDASACNYGSKIFNKVNFGREHWIRLVNSFMDVAKNLSSVEINESRVSRLTMRLILASPNCPTRIDLSYSLSSPIYSPLSRSTRLAGPTDPEEAAEQAQVDRGVQRLESFRCEGIGLSDAQSEEADLTNRPPFSNLKELDITGPIGIDKTGIEIQFKASDFPVLSTLRVPFIALDLLQFEQLPTLKRLYLIAPSTAAGCLKVKLERLCTFTSLPFLSIGIYMQQASIDSGLAQFFNDLPPLLTHLEFPNRVPFDLLLAAISVTGRLSIGVTKPLAYEQGKKLRIERLRAALQTSDGSVYYIRKEDTRKEVSPLEPQRPR